MENKLFFITIGVFLQLGLNAQSDYQFAFKDDYDNFKPAFGIRVSLCGSEKDSDKEVIADKKLLDLAINPVQFETGSAIITKSSYKILDDVYKVLVRYPEMNLMIEGNTDNVGDENKNQLLSEKRAEICMMYLIKKGIQASRMKFKGNGENNPAGDNTTAEGRKMNRRTEFLPIWR
ncbi:MAG: OmpA family protein [Saprospiraceae bacterium]